MFRVFEKTFENLIVLSVLVFFQGIAFAGGDFGIVAANLLNLRSAPGFDGPILCVIPGGAKVEIEGGMDGWLKVRYEGKTGYIRDLPKFVHVVRMPGENESEHGWDAEIPKYRQESERLQERIEASEKLLGRLETKEDVLLTKLDEMDLALNEAWRRTETCRAELAALEKEMENARLLAEQYGKKVDSLAEYARKRLVAIYKTNRLGWISVAASAESVSELFFRQNALERIFAHDEKIRADLIEKSARAKELSVRANAQRTEKAELENNLRNEIETMTIERKKREIFLAKVQKEKSTALTLFEAYRQAARILDEKLGGLDTDKKTDPSVIYLSSVDFESFKGLLNLPVEGKIGDTFGLRNRKVKDRRFSGGITIKAERGDPVHAVKDGRILFSGWFKGYGNMIIVDHGRHYYTVYACAQDLFKAQGDLVDSGEVIATVGDSGSKSGPGLYFEVRHHGKPVDPMEWIRR